MVLVCFLNKKHWTRALLYTEIKVKVMWQCPMILTFNDRRVNNAKTVKWHFSQ